jgi:hypothetical protein
MKFKQRPWDSEDNIFTVPDVKPISWKAGALGLAVIGGASIGIGAAIGTYVVVGALSLAGVIYVIETNKYIKYAVTKTNKVIDVLILIASIFGAMTLGVTVGVSLVITGIGFTIYAQRLRSKTNK